MSIFIDNLLLIIKKYLWYTELDTDNEGNPYDGEMEYIYVYIHTSLCISSYVFT
jgi:hypothetical protein